MAAETQRGLTGNRAQAYRSVITAAEANQLKAAPGLVDAVIVHGDTAGTTCLVDVYDHASTATNRVFRWATAQGLGVFRIECPMGTGIRVVTAGTLPANGGVTIIWA